MKKNELQQSLIELLLSAKASGVSQQDVYDALTEASRAVYFPDQNP